MGATVYSPNFLEGLFSETGFPACEVLRTWAYTTDDQPATVRSVLRAASFASSRSSAVRRTPQRSPGKFVANPPATPMLRSPAYPPRLPSPEARFFTGLKATTVSGSRPRLILDPATKPHQAI